MRKMVSVLLPIALCGCLEVLRVVVSDRRTLQPEFQFRSQGLLGGTETVQLRMFTVSAKRDGSKEVVWSIQSRAALIAEQATPRPAQLRQLQYGVAPDGFRTEVPPQPLEWGKTYRVDAVLKVEGRESVAGAGGEFILLGP